MGNEREQIEGDNKESARNECKIQIRTKQEVKALMAEAARLENAKLSTWLVRLGIEEAQNRIASQSSLRLSGKEGAAFIEALDKAEATLIEKSRPAASRVHRSKKERLKGER